MKKRLLLLVGMLLLPAPYVMAAGDFGAANRAYVAGDFEEAARGYSALAERGVENEDVYYNLGNAEFRLGRLGHAIYNYERALRVAPHLSDARYNLEVARGAVAERVRDRLVGAETPPWWVRAATWMTISEMTVVLLFGNLLFFAMLAALRFLYSGFRRSVLLVVSSFCAVGLLLLGFLYVANVYEREVLTTAIILPEQLLLREGKGEQTAERGQLHAGLRVRVLDKGADWVLVRLSNGVEGWVEARHVGLL